MRGSGRVVTIAGCGLLVLLAAGGGVAFVVSQGSTTAPGAAAPGGSAAVMVDPPVTAAPPRIVPLPGSGRPPTADGVQARLAGALANPALGQLAGIVIDPAAGATMWSKSSTAPQLPASTAKLLTGAALLTSTHSTDRLVTRVVVGDQAGDIVLVGGGDVTLSARKPRESTVYQGAPMLADLATQVRASGLPVHRIVLDTGYWTGPDLATGWQTADIRGTPGSAQGYTTRMSALMVDGDRVDPGNENSIRTGDPAATTGKALAGLLGAPDLPLVNGTAPSDARVIGEVSSQPMSVLLAQALEQSDNVLAEALGRQVAIARGAPPSFTGEAAAIIDAIDALHIDTIGVELFDGSGLSTRDRVPPAVLARLLALGVTGQPAALRDLLTGLPVAGVSGSLTDRFQDPGSRAGAGWVRAKTGSLQATYGLAGYVPDVDGRVLVFAFTSTPVTAATRPALDTLAAALRGCGCG